MLWSRGDDGTWTELQAQDGEQAELGSIGARLDVRALYDAVIEPT